MTVRYDRLNYRPRHSIYHVVSWQPWIIRMVLLLYDPSSWQTWHFFIKSYFTKLVRYYIIYASIVVRRRGDSIDNLINYYILYYTSGVVVYTSTTDRFWISRGSNKRLYHWILFCMILKFIHSLLRNLLKRNFKTIYLRTFTCGQ